MPALSRHFPESCLAPHIYSKGTPRSGRAGTCQGHRAVAERVHRPQPWLSLKPDIDLPMCLHTRPHQSPWPAPPSPHTDLRAAPVPLPGALAKFSVVVISHQPTPAKQALLPPELPEPPNQALGCLLGLHCFLPPKVQLSPGPVRGS